jgi:lysophospholipase L1-like esterase
MGITRRAAAMAGGLGILFGAVLKRPIGAKTFEARARVLPASPPDWLAFSAAPIESPLRLLFIHHSCGGQLLAPEGVERDRPAPVCIYESHPNGGGLRPLLAKSGYEVHEASYTSIIGERTDLFDWEPKFREQMVRVLSTDDQDRVYEDDRKNQVVVFKSCFPNSVFVAEGTAPGDARGPELTVAKAKAALKALLPLFERHPDVLFVYVTAPPVAPFAPGEPLYRLIARRLRGRPTWSDTVRASGPLARAFNDWVVGKSGWLSAYSKPNVAVFDYYGILTGAESNYSRFTASESDSHPSAEGNRRAAEALVPLLNRAVRRAGLVSEMAAVAAP